MTRTAALIRILTLTCLICLSTGHYYAQAEEVTGYPPECVEKFKAMDTDGDGKITIEEFAVAVPIPTYAGRKTAKEQFMRMDNNGDGVITIDEYCIVKELKEGEKEPTPEEECEEQFKKCDTDGNGRLNLTELFNCSQTQSYGSRKASKNTFILMDKNHDEELTREEFCAGAPTLPTE
jgi:Ca2+-binding EF-hand superfamily protein